MAWRIIGITASVPLLFFAPGYLLFRSRFFSAAKTSWTEKLLVIVAVSTSASSLVALALAEFGHFSIWLLDLIVAVLAVLARLLFGSTHRSLLFPRPRKWELVAVVILVAISLVSFFNPAEYVSGDADPGYYFNNGYHIAKTGSVNIYDKAVPHMSEAELKTFFQVGIVQFMPFHLRDRATGRIQPLLYHMLPVWIATFVVLFGKTGGLYVVPVFSLLAILVIFALALRLSRSVFGAAAAGALAVFFFPQSWFSRFPSSEVFAQFFLLSSVLFFIICLQNRDRLSPVASALAITAASTVRPEAALVTVPMLLIMAWQVLRGRYGGSERLFVNATLIGLVYVWCYIRFADYPYIHTAVRKLLHVVRQRSAMDVFMLAVLGAIGLMFVLFNLKPLHRLLARLTTALSSRLERFGPAGSKALRAVLALGLLGVFTFFYFGAPRIADSASPLRFFFRASVFFGGVAVFVFVIGLCLLVYEQDPRISFLVSVLVLIFMFAFTEAGLTAGYLPWLTRRYLPVVIPFLCIGLGYLVGRLVRARQPALKAAGVAVVAGFLVLFGIFTVPSLDRVDYRGIDHQLSALSKKMDDDLVIFTDSFLGEAIGLPLRYQYGTNARVAYQLSDPRDLAAIVKKYNGQGQKVLVQGSGALVPGMNPGIYDRLSFKKAFAVVVSFPRMGKTFTARPYVFGTEKHRLDFYYVTPRKGVAKTPTAGTRLNGRDAAT